MTYLRNFFHLPLECNQRRNHKHMTLGCLYSLLCCNICEFFEHIHQHLNTVAWISSYLNFVIRSFFCTIQKCFYSYLYVCEKVGFIIFAYLGLPVIWNLNNCFKTHLMYNLRHTCFETNIFHTPPSHTISSLLKHGLAWILHLMERWGKLNQVSTNTLCNEF